MLDILPSLPEVTEIQVHVLIGCADAREVGQAHVDAVRTVRSRYRERGIQVYFHTIRTPGSFVTADVMEDLRRIIVDSEHQYFVPDTPMRYFVHIQAHGALAESAQGCFTLATAQLHIVTGSPLNCGMLGATGVGLEMEEMILRVAPEVVLPNGRTLKVGTEDAIRVLLREVYAHDGYLAGDWLRSIDDLRTHARSQKTVLERAIATDPGLRRLDLSVTAVIQDYAQHRQVRLDCGEVEARFWDEVQEFVAQRFAERGEEDPDFAAQREKQKPIAGMFAMDDPTASPRDLAGTHFAQRKGIVDAEYRPNRLFVLGGSTFDLPRTPFGPYNIAGFFYAIRHLEVYDFLVVGGNPAQTQRMVAKIGNDPLMSVIAREMAVQFHPISAEELIGGA